MASRSARRQIEVLLNDVRAFPGVASGTGTASNATTLPVTPATVAGTTSVPTPTFPFVRIFPAVIAATTTLGAPTVIGATLPTPDTIAAAASIPTPLIGTLVIVSTISGAASAGAPVVARAASPETISAVAIIVTPAIHATSDSVPVATTPRWSLRDPETGVLYEFDINPSQVDTPADIKNILYQNTLPGKSIIYEVTRDAQNIGWSGTLLLQGQLAALQTWYDRGIAVELTDDLGNVYSIFITEFMPKRVRQMEYPWFHTYDMKALVLA